MPTESRRIAFPRLRLVELGLMKYQCDTTRFCAIGVYDDSQNDYSLPTIYTIWF